MQKLKTPQKDGGINGGINSLLAYLESNPGKKTADIGKGISVSTRTAERYIKEAERRRQDESSEAVKKPVDTTKSRGSGGTDRERE